MRPAFYLRTMLRESRGSRGRLVFFVLCLAVGVSAVVAVAGLATGLERTIRTEARQLLAADLVVLGRRPLPPEVDQALRSVSGALRTDIKEMATVVAAPAEGERPGKSLLVELKVVRGEYPFYGRLRLDPDGPLGAILDDDSAVVGSELLTRLMLRAGDILRIGGVDFRIAGQVLAEPDRLNFSFTLGPRVFISEGGLERTELERFGSRIDYRALIRLPTRSTATQIEAAAARIKAALPGREHYEVQTYSEAQPALREGLRRAGRFLGLVALLSLLIGGVGVAQTVRAWLAGRMDAIATLKCLGFRPREVLLLYVGQTFLLGLAGSLVGAVVGTFIQLVVPKIVGGLLATAVIHLWQPSVLLRGLGLGIGVALVFSLAPLLSVRNVPPSRVIRRDAEPLPSGRLAHAAMGLAILGGVYAAAVVQARSQVEGALFTAGIVTVVAVLAAAGFLLSWVVARLPRELGRVWVRHGLAALARPGAGTMGAIVALGLGVLVVIAMYVVEDRLSGQLEADLPAAAPTAFLVDIQPAQWPGVRGVLQAHGATRIDSVPVIMARLAAVDGHSVEELAVRDRTNKGRRRWALTREQRLTYLSKLPEGNVVVEGALWSDPARPEVSIEKDFAQDLDARVGSTLTLDLQGVRLDLAVSSIRTVDWKSFGINFFLIAEPGVLEEAPQFRVAAAKLPPGGEQGIQDSLAAKFPNVTLIQIREILEKVVAVMRRVGLGIRILGGFTVLAGVIILAGAVSAGSVRRGREVALLKTLGMTRGNVLAVFSVEYALIGLTAGIIGSAGAGLLAWAVLTRGMEIAWEFSPATFAVGIVGSALLSVIAGIAASLRALSRRPLEGGRSFI